MQHLRRHHATFLFHSASSFLPKTPSNDPKAKGKAKESADDAAGADALLEYLGQCAGRVQSENLQVAIVGLTNVSPHSVLTLPCLMRIPNRQSGKSAIVNSLVRKAVVAVYSPTSSTDAWRTTTTRASEIPVDVAGHKISLVDTPGVSFEVEEDLDENLKTRDMVLRSRGRVDKVKDPVPACKSLCLNAASPLIHVWFPLYSGTYRVAGGHTGPNGALQPSRIRSG